jgi:GAF domain-containing protein/anti-sigma regulatory factor (Ser/Thr protein kinase)
MDEAVFSQFPSGLHILDTQLRLLRFNSSAKNRERFPLEGRIGHSMKEILRDFDIDEHTIETAYRLARSVLETGEPVHDFEGRARTFSDPRFEAVFSVSWFRLQDPDGGRVLGVAAVLTDITEQLRAQQRLRLLDRAGTRIGATLDIVRTAQELADAAVPELADVVTVDLLDPVLSGEAPARGESLERLPLRRVGYRSGLDQPDRGLAGVGQISGASLGAQLRHSLADLRPQLVRALDRDPEWLAADPDQVRRLLAVGVHSLMAVPLTARGVVLGLVCLYRCRDPLAYEEGDLVLAAQLAARAALCLDNARLYARELSAARILRLSLRPAEVPEHAALETAQSYVPSGSGGDWFDVIQLSGARVALVVGSTSGRSIQAAAAMGELRAAIRALSGLDLLPDELLSRLHDLVARLGGERRSAARAGPEVEPWRATCLYTVYDPVSRRYSMARAGDQPAPAVVGPDGSAELVHLPEGRALGEGVADYTTVVRTLPEGSVITLYNAALIENSSTEERRRRLDRLREVLAPEGRSLQEACDIILEARSRGRSAHDAVLLLARTRVLDADHLASWVLPNDPAAVSRARRLVAEQLDRWGLEELGFSTELVVSELVTNAVRYSNGPVALRLIRDRALICEVADEAATSPQLRRADDADEGGRGLFIVSQVTQRWGYRPSRRGKAIWTEQALPE